MVDPAWFIMYPIEMIPECWHIIIVAKMVFAAMTYILVKWVNERLSSQESEYERQLKKLRDELSQTKNENFRLIQQIDEERQSNEDERTKVKQLEDKLDFQETLFEREYEKRMEQEERAKCIQSELEVAKLEVSKHPMVKQIFKSKIRGLEKQLVWVMWRFRKKESKCNALLLSEKELKEQLTTCKSEKEELMLEVETCRSKLTKRKSKDEEMMKELKNLQTYLDKSPSVYKKGTKKKMVGHLINTLETSMNDVRLT